MDKEIKKLKGSLSYDDSVSLIMNVINDIIDDKMNDSDPMKPKLI